MKRIVYGKTQPKQRIGNTTPNVSLPIAQELQCGKLNKNIFLIWFGDQIPSYVYNSANAYRKMNPSWNVRLILKSKQEILDSNDDILNRCKEYIKQVVTGSGTNKYSQRIKAEIEQRLNYLQILSDIYRFELLYENGGIYVDCDTLPLIPFDSLNIPDDGFNTISFGWFKKIKNPTWKTAQLSDSILNQSISQKCYDIFLFALPKGYDDSVLKFTYTSIFKNRTLAIWDRNIEQQLEFQKMRQKFLFGQMTNATEICDSLKLTTPIVHFANQTWKNHDVFESPLYCELDDTIYQNNIRCRSYDSIPKNLIFIWIGDELPKYANISIESYRKMNPDFNIIFKRFTIKDIENPTDKHLKRAIDLILEVKDGIRNSYYDFIRRYLDEGRKFCQVVANVLRFVVLDDIGGIYLDLDTLPLKPFDDELLMSGSFNSICDGYRNLAGYEKQGYDSKDLYDNMYKSNPTNYKYYIFPDIFMIGHTPGQDTIKYTKYVTIQNNFDTGKYTRNEILNDQVFLQNRLSFLNGELTQYKENSNKYIVHFMDGTWLANDKGIIRTPMCKYDYQETIDIPQFIDYSGLEYIDNGIISYQSGMVEFIVNPTIEQKKQFGRMRISDQERDKADRLNVKIHDTIQWMWRNGIEV